jgi:hypothetical protein
MARLAMRIHSALSFAVETMFLYGAEDLPPLPTPYVRDYLTYGGGAFGNHTYDPGSPRYFEMMGQQKFEDI